MNDLSFIASVIGSLAIPATVVAALLIFRRPLAELLGRIISYEGLGQKINFGQRLAGAEKSVSRAVAQAQETAERAKLGSPDTEQPIVEHALWQITSAEQKSQDIDLQTAGLVQLAEMATSNPSFVVIKAWDDLSAALTRMVKAILPAADVRDPIYWLPEVAKAGYVSESFPSAVLDLFELRNNVAHGQHNPTAGEAVTYVESVRQLVGVAAGARAWALGLRYVRKQADKTTAQQQPEPGPTDDP